MNLEQTIQACFDHYPTLFQERHQVLDQLFCTIGNGYFWKKGELVDYEEDVPINSLDENGKAKQYNIITKGDARKNQYKRIKENPETYDFYTELFSKRKETLEENLLSPKDDDNEPEKIIKHTTYPLSLEYSYIFNYPKNIKPDWLEGIKETYEYIIDNVPNDSINCKDIQTFRAIKKEELINMYLEIL